VSFRSIFSVFSSVSIVLFVFSGFVASLVSVRV